MNDAEQEAETFLVIICVPSLWSRHPQPTGIIVSYSSTLRLTYSSESNPQRHAERFKSKVKMLNQSEIICSRKAAK